MTTPNPEPARCTGVAARWCEIHGDCTCPENAVELNGYGCPLHGDHTKHGDPELTGGGVPAAASATTADDSSDLRTWNVPDEVLHSAAFQMAGNVAHHLLDAEIERLKASGDFRRTVEVAWMNGVRAALAARGAGLSNLRVPEHLRGDGPCTDCGTVDNIIWSAPATST